MNERTAAELAEAVSLLLHQKLGVNGGGLEARLARAGRRLPRHIRRRVAEIVEAERREGSPKLARMTDLAELHRAFAEVERHLTKIDLTDRRKGAVLGVLGSITFGLLAVFAALTAFLLWRGYL